MLIHQEGLTFTTAVYVMTQIVTTVGYGDICVKSDGDTPFFTEQDVEEHFNQRYDLETVDDSL